MAVETTGRPVTDWPAVRTDRGALPARAVTLGDALLASAERAPERAALITPEGTTTYGALGQRATAIARGLMALGVGPGDHVASLMPNTVDSIAAMCGIWLAGAALVPVNARYRATDMGWVLRHADVRAVITAGGEADHVDLTVRLGEALDQEPAPALRHVVVLGERTVPGTVSERELLALGEAIADGQHAHRRATTRVRGTALILFTSGTTATPSGCVITHEALMRCWANGAHQLGFDGEDRIWIPLPFYHVAGIGLITVALSLGATLLSDPHFEPGRALDLIEGERATVLYPCFPPVTMGVVNHPTFSERDLSSVKVMMNTAPPDTMRLTQAAIPHCTQVSTYGMSETCGVVTMPDLSDDDEVRAVTVGRPLPGLEVRIVDPETGADRPVGEPGEILVRGASIFEGYYKEPEKTGRAFDADGWFHTGDGGVQDADGRLAYVGRIKDTMKVGGENVAPAEVESWLSTHPAVHLVQVVGVPDPRLAEVPVAYVELKPGASATEDELIAFCQGRLAAFKVPRHVRFVTEWPMSATKIQKFKLKERFAAETA